MKTEKFLNDLLAWRYDEILSAREFLQLYSSSRERIKRVEFLFPGVGPGRFGSFAVEYKSVKPVQR